MGRITERSYWITTPLDNKLTGSWIRDQLASQPASQQPTKRVTGNKRDGAPETDGMVRDNLHNELSGSVATWLIYGCRAHTDLTNR